MKIYAPVENTNGVYASVRFVNGVGQTDKPHLIEWFRANGYRLEEEEKPIYEFLADKYPGVDFQNMTVPELREWMKENGYLMQVGNWKKKEKLLEIMRGEGCDPWSTKK